MLLDAFFSLETYCKINSTKILTKLHPHFCLSLLVKKLSADKPHTANRERESRESLLTINN